jgi:hypothetical protein
MTAMEQMGMMMANIPMPHRQPMFASALSTMNAEQQPGYLLLRTGYHSLSTSRRVNMLLAHWKSGMIRPAAPV